MDTLEELKHRRERVLEELGGLDEIRRGSVVEQFVEATRKDGTSIRRGPYFLHTYKEKGKTISRRLRDAEEANLYRRQIRSFRRFQELSGELREIGERLSDLVGGRQAVKKTFRSKSRSRKTRK